MNYDFSDEITAATVITYRGEVVHAPTAKLLGVEPAAAPASPRRSSRPRPPRAGRGRGRPRRGGRSEPGRPRSRVPRPQRSSSRRGRDRRGRPRPPSRHRTPRPTRPPRPRPRRPSRPMDRVPVHRQPHERRRRVSTELLNSLAIFVLAILVGFEVISKVPATLHTPLMSGANSIHGIVLVGAMIIAASGRPAAELRARVRGHRVRRRQRGRWLRGHRPDAPDVQEEAGRRQDRRDEGGLSRCRSSGSSPSPSSLGWRAPRRSCSACT